MAAGRVLLAPPGASTPRPTPSFHVGVSLLLFSTEVCSRGGLGGRWSGARVCDACGGLSVIWGGELGYRPAFSVQYCVRGVEAGLLLLAQIVYFPLKK